MSVHSEIAAGVVEAFWCTHEDQDEFKDALYLAGEFWHAIDRAVTEFLANMPEGFMEKLPLSLDQIGNDLWFTAQGHGVGFWDRGLGAVGDRLTEIAGDTELADVEPYVGDDGLVYP